MIADARRREHPFDIILTLTTSRFFRDATQARIYKHRLDKHGVKVMAIHQETKDDPMGGFMEGIFELIDQYESDMNGYHTLRAMKENARKGYCNGSSPRYGFMAVEERNV
jgi:DNA invertase Pin-like site-specific DNA recombinase